MKEWPDLSKRCESKHDYFEGGLHFWCCAPHCLDFIDANKKKGKISKSSNQVGEKIGE